MPDLRGVPAGAEVEGAVVDRPVDRALPWETRVVAWIPTSPLAAGWILSLSLTAGALLFFVATGGPIVIREFGSATMASEFVTAAVVSLLIGYTIAAGPYLSESAARDLVEAGRMRPEVFAPENVRWLHGVPCATLRRSRLAGLVGIGFGVWLTQHVGEPAIGRSGIDLGSSALWTTVFTPLLFYVLARAAYMTTFGAMGGQVGPLRIPAGEIDLLDMRAHLVEGRVGLRLALVWIIGSTISSLLFFDPTFTMSLLPITALGVLVAALALVLPVRRLHRRIRDAKARELAAVRARVGPVRDAVLRGEHGAEGRLADLLAYYDHLVDVREWPFDNRTLSRFVLYLLIPLGSWLGGALVERLVSSVLD